MTIGRTYYSDSDMMRMQQDAAERVREMQRRAQRTLEQAGSEDFFPPPPPRRRWREDPNTGEAGPRQPVDAPPPPERREAGPPTPAPPEPSPAAPQGGDTADRGAPTPTGPQAPTPSGPAGPPPPQAPPPPEPEAVEGGSISTMLQDIVKAVGLDDDRLLIIGLLLILINEKADDTLILALCYLLL